MKQSVNNSRFRIDSIRRAGLQCSQAGTDSPALTDSHEEVAPMRRRRLAWLLTLVLAMELAALCCAGVHLGCHGGMHADRCPV